MAEVNGKDIATLVSEIDTNLNRADLLARGLSDEQFNWSPEPGRWSIAQNFAHLNIIKAQDINALRTAIDKGRSQKLTGNGPFQYGFLSRKFVGSMEPPVTRKFKSPGYYQPPPDAKLDHTLSEYRKLSGEVRKLAVSASGLDLARVKTKLSALPALVQMIITMPLGARLELLTAHDRRHFAQAEHVRKHAKFPALK